MNMKDINKKVNDLNGIMTLVKILVTLVTTLWIIFGYLQGQKFIMDKILQNTLKNTITNENLTMEERLDACDIYLDNGYNSATEKKCKVLYNNYGE